jgi:hypothetical protein
LHGMNMYNLPFGSTCRSASCLGKCVAPITPGNFISPQLTCAMSGRWWPEARQ